MLNRLEAEWKLRWTSLRIWHILISNIIMNKEQHALKSTTPLILRAPVSNQESPPTQVHSGKDPVVVRHGRAQYLSAVQDQEEGTVGQPLQLGQLLQLRGGVQPTNRIISGLQGALRQVLEATGGAAEIEI